MKAMGALTRGQRVDRYVLLEALGEGGMGTVWLAHPYDAPEQLVAIKMVLAEYTSDPRVCAMFVKEASLAASINHTNVVHLFDVGLHEDTPFFVMEWIDGYALRDVAGVVADTGDRVPPAIALRIASDLCAGLHAAHELRGDDGQPLGLVHRDVSPHNVLITRGGVAKLIDFGVAKARDLATGSDQSVCGGIKGKVRYMAPEQALEKVIDRRADLFSVGAIMFQLLTGRTPFEASSELAVINQLVSTNPVFVPNDLPEPVQWILRRALARRPENRFNDAQEMQDAIEVALAELQQPDSHADVAECLAWFHPLEEERVHRGGASSVGFDSVRPTREPLTTHSPPLAFATPKNAIPAAVGPVVQDDVMFEMTRRQRTHEANASSWRFVLLGAAFVGVLGFGAALLVKESPTRAKAATHELAADLDEPATLPSAIPSTIAAAPPITTPILDIGDLEDSRAKHSAKPKVRRATAPSAHAPPKNPYASK
jgi:serine/threonine-protein kinase